MRVTAVALALIGVTALAAVSVGGASAQNPDGDTDVNLSEANVMDIEYSPSGSGAYSFDVTLYHDDSGEDGYANWWQVETLKGNRLGRRDLLHAHGTREFTRSETVEVLGGTRYVVVRGHDETHGYGGRVAVVDLRDDEVEFVDQGDEAQSFSGYSGSKTETNSNRTESASGSDEDSQDETETDRSGSESGSQPQPGFGISAVASVFLLGMIRRLLNR